MQVDVTDECRAGEIMRGNVEQAAKEVIDAVESVSELRLPPAVNVRLVSPRSLRQVNTELFGAIFATIDRRHPELPGDQVQVARIAAGVVSRLTMSMFWRGIGGQYIPKIGDAPAQVLIMPRALRLSRATDRELRVILAHELTHGAQDRACPMMTVDGIAQVIAIPTKDVRAAKSKLAQISPVIEGHAQWVHLRVCNELFGLDMRGREHRFDGNGAWSYRMSKAMARHNPVMRAKAGDYDKGEYFIDYLHSVGGMRMVNRLWRGLTSMPDATELTVPEMWVDRVAPDA
jgi:hypothetical protein